MALETVTLGEAKTEKNYHMTSLICGFVTYKTKKLTDLEKELMVAGGKDQGTEQLGSLGPTCTHCYI